MFAATPGKRINVPPSSKRTRNFYFPSERRARGEVKFFIRHRGHDCCDVFRLLSFVSSRAEAGPLRAGTRGMNFKFTIFLNRLRWPYISLKGADIWTLLRFFEISRLIWLSVFRKGGEKFIRFTFSDNRRWRVHLTRHVILMVQRLKWLRQIQAILNKTY